MSKEPKYLDLPSPCKVVQLSDQMVCDRCQLSWDPNPPQCNYCHTEQEDPNKCQCKDEHGNPLNDTEIIKCVYCGHPLTSLDVIASFVGKLHVLRVHYRCVPMGTPRHDYLITVPKDF